MRASSAVMSPQGVSATEKELQGRVVTLEQSVADLQAKIALLEGRSFVNTNDGVSNAKTAKPAPVKKEVHRVQKVLTPGASAAAKSTGKSASNAMVNKSFTLNTIYAGQAWIQDSEQVFVVQVGDLVGDMQIQRIDPKARLVMTTKGEIR